MSYWRLVLLHACELGLSWALPRADNSGKLLIGRLDPSNKDVKTMYFCVGLLHAA